MVLLNPLHDQVSFMYKLKRITLFNTTAFSLNTNLSSSKRFHLKKRVCLQILLVVRTYKLVCLYVAMCDKKLNFVVFIYFRINPCIYKASPGLLL